MCRYRGCGCSAHCGAADATSPCTAIRLTAAAAAPVVPGSVSRSRAGHAVGRRVAGCAGPLQPTGWSSKRFSGGRCRTAFPSHLWAPPCLGCCLPCDPLSTPTPTHPPPPEVRCEALHQQVRLELLQPPHCGRKVAGAAVGEIVPVHAGQHHIPHAPVCRQAATPQRRAYKQRHI